MESCLFPALDYTVPAHRGETQALTFSLCDEGEKLGALGKAMGTANLYELLWALVLRVYTGNETVAFRTQSDIGDDEDARSRSDSICSAVMSKSQTVSSVELRHARDTSWVVNTKVLYDRPKALDHCVDKGSNESIIRDENGHSLLVNPMQKIGEIRSLSDRDLDQIAAWNGGSRQGLESTVHGEISWHVKSRPDAPALHAWDGNLTYDQLDNVSEVLKSQLCDLGVRVGELIPVYFEKSLWAAVAMLGVLKAGNEYQHRGAFVPLDPSNPPDRTKEIIASVSARFVLTSAIYKSTFEDSELRTVVVDKFVYKEEGMSSMRTVNVSPHSPAFVLFTSGSTGQPKGVIQDHASVCTISKAYGETLYVDHNSRVLQFASYAFDVSTVDIFNTLMHGGCVCMPSEYQRKNEIISVINNMKVTWADITPSFSTTFAPEDVPCLRTIVLAGEEVKKEHVERWAGKVRLINCYGPSECGGCTAFEYAGSDSPPTTIGYPLPCFKFWVVAEDDVNRLVSVGTVGELLVEGPTLARGYLNDESRTREAFIKNPKWLAKVGACARRFYRTKDLVRYRTDGSLKFVGRSDTQIKIRGQRVELGEIESQLTQHFGLVKSMVAFPKTGKYANQLVAVIEKGGGETGHNTDAAMNFMRKKLPEYMVPSVWLAVDRIPLSTSIKVDRRQVDHRLAGLGPNATYFTVLGIQNHVSFFPIPPSNTLAHEISIRVAEQLAPTNNHRSTSLIGHDFGLAAVGFDSIQAMTLRMWIKKKYGANIPVSKLTSDTVSISSLADLISHPPESASNVKLLQEVEALASELHARDTNRATKLIRLTSRARKFAFITGATGYLGREILDQLVHGSSFEKIFALVRCQSQAEGYTRIAEVAGKATVRNAERIEIWPGDLRRTRLGLSDEHWKRLSKEVNVIIHNGAVVRWNADYETLRKANVLSTMEILTSLLKSSFAKSFVYVSGGQQLTPGEDDDVANVQQATVSSGYAQTKLASELLVKQVAVSRPGSLHGFSIIKPSYIIGSVADGVANTTDYLWRLVAGAIEMQSHDGEGLDKFLYLSDVETVARWTIGAAMEPRMGAKAEVIKILDGITLGDFWQVVREAGYQLHAMPSEEWWCEMREKVQRGGEQDCLWPLMWMLEDGQRILAAAPGCPEPQADGGDDAEMMTSRMKAAVAKNLMWLREEKALPGF